MASGDTLAVFLPQHNEPPASNYMTLDSRNSQPCLDADAATDEDAVFSSVLPSNYAGSGLSVILVWSASSATSGNVKWNVQIERQDDEGLDTDADSFAAAQTATAAAPGTSGARQYTTVSLTNAQIDGLLLNEAYRLKVTRDANDAGDTMAGDAEVVRVHVRES